MNKILIIFGTRKGTTAETVTVIGQVLTNEFHFEVDICESHQIKKFKKRLDEYPTIIIGSSIVSGRWKSRVLSFAKKKLFDGKKIALFVTAGGTMNKVNKYGYTKEEAIGEAIQKYIDKYAPKFRFSPISKTAFGGKVVRKEQVRYNNWNKEDIENWTRDLAHIIHNEKIPT